MMMKKIRRDQFAPNICDSDPILPIPNYQSQSDTAIPILILIRTYVLT